MNREIQRIVQEIHDTPGRAMIVTAGAGPQAIAWLLGVAGASRTLIEALVPYEESSFDDFLGQKPTQYVAPETAGLLAGRAVRRARQLWQGPEPVIGLACTATIVTDRPKLGEHRAHICVWTPKTIIHHSLLLHKGARNRNDEEQLVSRLLLNTLAEAYRLDSRLELQLITGDEHSCTRYEVGQVARQLLAGEREYFFVTADGLPVEMAEGSALLSGAFNPLHQGHIALAKAAAEMLGRDVVFELTAFNVDKSALSAAQCLDRLLQFSGRYPIMVSAAPTFVAKARLFPRTTFIVGYDTATRILQPRYYDDDEEQMITALAEVGERGCSFLVAGRIDDQGNFHEPGELVVPESLASLFQPLPSNRFRKDISSSEIRARSDR